MDSSLSGDGAGLLEASVRTELTHTPSPGKGDISLGIAEGIDGRYLKGGIGPFVNRMIRSRGTEETLQTSELQGGRSYG